MKNFFKSVLTLLFLSAALITTAQSNTVTKVVASDLVHFYVLNDTTWVGSAIYANDTIMLTSPGPNAVRVVTTLVNDEIFGKSISGSGDRTSPYKIPAALFSDVIHINDDNTLLHFKKLSGWY